MKVPSPAGFRLRVFRHVLLAIACAAAIQGCKRPTLPNDIAAGDVQHLAANTPAEARDVRFGDRFMLLAAQNTRTDEGSTLELAWKSTAKQALKCHVAIHLVDAAGKILAQADYDQDKTQTDVRPEMMWRDTVQIPTASLRGATAIAIGLMEGSDSWLLADRGPRDWDNKRLLIPLAEKVPAFDEKSSIDGYLEAVHADGVVGWVWNKEQPADTVEVEILDGSQVIAKLPASDLRDDLLKNKIGDGKHGFKFVTPQALKDGKKHNIHVRVAGTKTELKGSPRAFSVSKK